MPNRQNKTVLITGGAGGIGRATVRRLSSNWQVAIADKNGEAARVLVAELGEQGARVHAVEVDVSSRSSVAAMMDSIERELGPVHALFSNAGINRRAPIQDISQADWDLLLRTHVRGSFLCAQAVLPGMIERGGGAILMMSSDYAIIGMAGAAAYATAKTAVYALTKCLAIEFAPHGIRVNALGPGPIDTPQLSSGRTAEQWDAARASLIANIPMRRLGRPDEVAAVADFLLSDRASYITGQIIHPNGGQISW